MNFWHLKFKIFFFPVPWLCCQYFYSKQFTFPVTVIVIIGLRFTEEGFSASGTSKQGRWSLSIQALLFVLF